jgi:protein tyrosine phosphatase (PTP) superfamily phosphohydrolase (DUF442 family)
MNFKNQFTLVAICFLIIFLGCNCKTEKIQIPRPEHWAIAIEREGLPNFYKVSDTLFRGAQPGKKGIEELKKMGIKTIINFRISNPDETLIKGTDLKYFHLPVFTLLPGKKAFERFLEIVSDPDNGPVFVHCKHGADRTGAAVAIYRIKVQNWDVEEAINEMVNGGYNFHRIHSHLKGFIRKFVEPDSG